jgi:signal transduction histidine kinase
MVATTLLLIALFGGATIVARDWTHDSWFSLLWTAGSLAASCAAVLLAGRRPGLATMLALAPFAWLLTDPRWLVWWEIAQLFVVARAAVGSWRRAVIPVVGVLAALVVIVSQHTRIVVSPNVVYHQWAIQPEGGMPWPLYNADLDHLLGQLLILAAVAVIAAALGVVARTSLSEMQLSRRQAELSDQAAVQAERARLASDLHDVVAHHVSLIAVRAETAPYQDPSMGDGPREVLGEIADDARRAMGELRGVLDVLGRAEAGIARVPQPSLRDLPELVLRSTRAGDRITAEGVEAPWIVPDTVGYVVYRVVQEALTNARRHARGGAVELELDRDGDEIVVRIVNGPGREAGSGSNRAHEVGQGLASMAERVEALGGVLVAGPHAGNGFYVTARVPIDSRP